MFDIEQILENSRNHEVQLEADKILLQPYYYSCADPSKDMNFEIFRPLNHWLRIPEDKLQLIEDILKNLLNCCLLFDDIQDNSVLRRGKPVAHSVFGIPRTINTGIYGYFLALDKTKLLDHPKAAKLFIEEVLELHRGQGTEIYSRNTCTVPTESEYMLLANRKTTTFFRLAVRLMQLFSSNQKDFSKFTVLLGLIYQISNDFYNLTKKEYMVNKGFCEDIEQGTFSFPIIHSIRVQNDKQLLPILQRRSDDVELKKFAVRLLEKNGSLAYTKSILQTLHTEIQKEIRYLGDNPSMENILNEMLA